jgi:glycosyltransferase involved in cell wall biosynthesis
VLCSNNSSLPEVCADAALMVSPFELQAINKGLEEMVFDDALRQNLVRKGHTRASEFSWDKCAMETGVVYAKLV